MLWLLSACQEEIAPEVEIGKDGITVDAPIAESIVAVATKDGSIDNIIDESSCTTVKFPVIGILEDNEMTFNSLSDVLALGVQGLEIDWVFPLQVILFDHTEIILLDEDMLEDIQDSCIEGGEDSDIECIDFVYPFTVSVFNERTEQVETKVLSSDKETYNIFSKEDLVVTIEYPVSLIDLYEITSVVNDNDELLLLINGAASECDEEDIIEFEYQFEKIIADLFISNTWKVTFYEEDGIDKTNVFSGYSIQFKEDFTLLVSGTQSLNGEWEVELLETTESISIDFATDAEPLLLLNEDWAIVSYDQTQIIVESEGDEGEIKKLQFSIN